MGIAAAGVGFFLITRLMCVCRERFVVRRGGRGIVRREGENNKKEKEPREGLDEWECVDLERDFGRGAGEKGKRSTSLEMSGENEKR